MTPELISKRLQLLREALPGATRAVVLWNPNNPFHTKVIQDFEAAATQMSIEPNFVAWRGAEDINSALSTVKRMSAQVLYLIDAPVSRNDRETLLLLASKAQIPLICEDRDLVGEGGFMSYGPNHADMFRSAADYVNKILKGAKPSDLPIEQPTKFEFVVNLKAANALGLTIEQSTLLRADEVIR